MYGVVFFRVKTGQLRVQQSAGPHDCIVPETVPQHVNGLFNLLLHQQLLRGVVEQGQLHMFVGGHKVNGGKAHAA